MGHVLFDTRKVRYEDFFQEGGGGYYYNGLPYQRGYGNQHGTGIGTAFRSLLRIIIPYAKEAGKILRTEGLHMGARVLDDLADGAKFKESLKQEAKIGLKNAAKSAMKRFPMQTGDGKKRKKRKPFSFNKRSIIGKPVAAIAVKKRKRIDSLGFY